MNKSGIELKNIELSFGNTKVIKDVSMKIENGEFFSFLGPSGCGKSTLLRLIAGFEQCQKGQVLIDGVDITHLPPWHRKVGMVFQSYALWPHMTIRQNVEFGLKEQKLDTKEISYKTDKALELVGLEEFASRYPNQLSGGQQQRVALARTIAIEPKVLLLDEPLSNLDANLRVQMRQELLSLQRELKLTTIFVTHDQEEANTTSDRIALLKDGIVQQIDTPTNLYDKPSNIFVANFIGQANIIEGETYKDGDNIFFKSNNKSKIPVDTNIIGKCSLLIRPNTLKISDENNYHIKGIINNKEFLGNVVRYFIKTNDYNMIIDFNHLKQVKLLNISDEIFLLSDIKENFVLETTTQ